MEVGLFLPSSRGSTLGIAAALVLLSLADVLVSTRPWPTKGLLALVCLAAFALLYHSLPRIPSTPSPLPDSGASPESAPLQFGSLFESAPASMVLLEPNGLMIRANRAFSAWLGYQPADLLQRRLRAPLRQVEAFSSIVLEDHSASLDPQARLSLERISTSVAHMGRMPHALQEFSRLGRHPMTPVACDLGDLAREAISAMEAVCRGRDITWDVSPLPFAECDPDLLRLVFQNLLSNAVKFTGRQPKAVIQLGCRRKSGADVFFVRDNGVGFPARRQDHLFGVFQRLHRQEDFEGTGVGLASVRRIVERHGGRVWAESGLGRGATFYFTLTSATDSPAVADELEVP